MAKIHVMKKLVTVIIFLFSFVAVYACEISIEIEKGEKEKYTAGDEIVVKVKMSFTHKVCNVSLQNTKFDAKGIEILGGTDWKETSPNVWERKLKIKIIGNAEGKSTLNVVRTCDKMGGYAAISFESKPVKRKSRKKDIAQ